MIKDFEEYKAYRSKRLDENISIVEEAQITKAMRDFEKANPEIFDKLAQEKWSCKGLKLLNPDGSVAKILE